MLINTRDFGKLDIDENEILTFKMPMLGYDEYEDYIVLFDEQVGDSFAWLQSIKNSALCFMLANPKMLKKDYAPEISNDTLEKLSGSFDEIWLVAVITDDIKDTKVNMKSPILINNSKHFAVQTVLESNYPIRYAIFDDKETDWLC